MERKELLKREIFEELQRESPSAIIELVMHLQQVVAEQREEIRELQQRIAELEERNRPPSAPFRIEEQKRKRALKRRGRKKGHKGSCREIPQYIDEEIEVKLEAEVCPDCGGQLCEKKAVVQYIEELPEIRPHVTKLTTYQTECKRCEKVMRSSHPRQMSTARGCAGVQLGVRAIGAAAILKHEIGMSFSKTCRTLKMLCGLKTTEGGLVQSFHRASEKLEIQYEQYVEDLRQGKVVHTDETSWWVQGACSLWVFCRDGENPITIYRVVEHRDRATFYEVIPADYKGVLNSDCLSVYDGATEVQQKCYAHHLKAWKIAKKNLNANNDTGWLEQVRKVLDQAMELKKSGESLETQEGKKKRRGLELAAQALFGVPRADPAEESFRNRIVKQQDHLFVFLDHPQVDATNNLAERQLRPAVIARKLSCGNKTAKGARTWEVLTSLAVTATQRSQSLIELFKKHLPLEAQFAANTS